MLKLKSLIDKLSTFHTLTVSEYKYLLDNYSAEIADYASEKAVNIRKQIYKTDVYVRGLIEISNICKNDCLYCGIRKSNKNCERYRLEKSEILECCKQGYNLGFRSFVMQGGEDAFYSDEVICDIIKSIKQNYPDCAVTLSIGERTKHSYENMRLAGADRYLLRHETANITHYNKLHPQNMSFDNRMECLKNLKEIGYQVGCGFMVGSPYQTNENIAEDLKFIEDFKPDMCGIGPFIPHNMTPFSECSAGSVEKTTFLLSLIRLIKPNILLPSTTALGTIDEEGTEKGIKAGANVIMPNLSPKNQRKKYELYNNKKFSGSEAAESMKELKNRMQKIGYNIAYLRGDIIK